MLNIKSGIKYREKIERKLSLAARKPTGALCDLDPLDEEVFGDTKDTEDSESEAEQSKPKAKKTKKKKAKSNQGQQRDATDDSNMFSEIMAASDDDEWKCDWEYINCITHRWKSDEIKFSSWNIAFYVSFKY